MSIRQNMALQRFQSLYMNPNGADVWFVFDGERIPGHKLILSAMSPWLNTMFYGSLPENEEVDMRDGNVSAESFKEFLRYIYLDKANLTMDNIEGVFSLAKLSLCDDFFAECESFLMDSITAETMFFGYQIALLYEANQLKKVCEDEICVNADKMLQSPSFLELRYEFLLLILQSDSLACEEMSIFNGCIAWAKAACNRNNLDASDDRNIRNQLKDMVHQIRFTSMTSEEAATCINSCPQLFSSDELKEIICMVANKTQFEPKQFNWTLRYFNLQAKEGRILRCTRFFKKKEPQTYNLERTEVTVFTCSQRVILRGFDCEYIGPNKAVNIRFDEMNLNKRQMTRFTRHTQLQLTEQTASGLREAYIALDRGILLRPKCTYKISITFENHDPRITSKCEWKRKVRMDHDIIFRFSSRGMISTLHFSRFDKVKYVRKVCRNPNFWFKLFILCMCILAYVFRHKLFG